METLIEFAAVVTTYVVAAATVAVTGRGKDAAIRFAREIHEVVTYARHGGE